MIVVWWYNMIYHSKLQQVSLKRSLYSSTSPTLLRPLALAAELSKVIGPSSLVGPVADCNAGSGNIMSSFHDDHDTHSVSISFHKILIPYLNIQHHMICTYGYIYNLKYHVFFLPIYTSLPFLKFQIQHVGFILDNQLHIQLLRVTRYSCCQRANKTAGLRNKQFVLTVLSWDAHQTSTGPLELQYDRGSLKQTKTSQHQTSSPSSLHSSACAWYLDTMLVVAMNKSCLWWCRKATGDVNTSAWELRNQLYRSRAKPC